jgi:hypothetical protein
MSEDLSCDLVDNLWILDLKVGLSFIALAVVAI